MEELSWKKIFSGKFLFTVITAFIFAYGVYAKVLNSEQVYGIIMLVVAFYFSKTESAKGENTNEETTTISRIVTSPVKPSESGSELNADAPKVTGP